MFILVINFWQLDEHTDALSLFIQLKNIFLNFCIFVLFMSSMHRTEHLLVPDVMVGASLAGGADGHCHVCQGTQR